MGVCKSINRTDGRGTGAGLKREGIENREFGAELRSAAAQPHSSYALSRGSESENVRWWIMDEGTEITVVLKSFK